jgi:hypothetical protein
MPAGRSGGRGHRADRRFGFPQVSRDVQSGDGADVTIGNIQERIQIRPGEISSERHVPACRNGKWKLGYSYPVKIKGLAGLQGVINI